LGGVLRRVFSPPQIGKGRIATASSKPRNDKKTRLRMTGGAGWSIEEGLFTSSNLEVGKIFTVG